MTSASEKALPIAIGILFVLLILMLLLRELAKRIDGELLIIMCLGYGPCPFFIYFGTQTHDLSLAVILFVGGGALLLATTLFLIDALKD